MARYQDPLSGLWIEEGELERREFSEDYTADYFDRDLFTSFYTYAVDSARAFEHNKMLYGRSAQKIQDNFQPIPVSGNRAQNQRNMNKRRAQQNQLSAAMAGQSEGWYSRPLAGNKGRTPRVWREYRPPTDFDGSTRGANVHNLILRRNKV